MDATTIKKVAGDEKQQHGAILEYAWKQKKRGLSERTIALRSYRLGRLVKAGADLNNPESVETVLATEKMTLATKRENVAAYRAFTKAFGIAWEPIKVRYEPKEPFIPLESEIDALVAGCGKRTATFLQALKDTGARAGEIVKLEWTDIDNQNSTVSINHPRRVRGHER